MQGGGPKRRKPSTERERERVYKMNHSCSLCRALDGEQRRLAQEREQRILAAQVVAGEATEQVKVQNKIQLIMFC